MRTFDLAAEAEQRIREAEERYAHERMIRLQERATEAMEANNALLMGVLLRGK